jgi:MFS family permease
VNDFTIKDHNHNLRYNLAHEFFWGFGVAFHTLYAVVPLFLRELSAPEYIVVSTAGVFSIAIAIPTLFSAALGRNLKNIKRSVIMVHCIILAVSFMMGFTFTIIEPNIVDKAWKTYLTYFILYAFSIGIIVPIWTDFLNQGTLRSHRGRFFGLGFAFNSLGSLVGGIALNYLLSSSIEFPRNFGIGFFILFFSLMMGTILFFPFRIKEKKKSEKHLSVGQFISDTLEIVREHQNFQKYLFSRIFYSACLPGMGLYAVYCQDKFNFALSEAGVFTVLTVTCAAISSYFAGKIGDRYGHINSMLLAYVGHLIAALIAKFAWGMYGVYMIFIAIGIGQGAFMPSAMNLIYDFSSKRDTKTYMALIDSILAPFVLFYMVLIGWLVKRGNYELSLNILVVSLLIGVLIMFFIVEDPKNEKMI